VEAVTLRGFLLDRIADDKQWCLVLREASARLGEDAGVKAAFAGLLPTLLQFLDDPRVNQLMLQRTASGVKPPNELEQLLLTCEAKLQIVLMENPYVDESMRVVWFNTHWDAMAHMAVEYAAHPDYDEGWRP
jgi:hypothetical protein